VKIQIVISSFCSDGWYFREKYIFPQKSMGGTQANCAKSSVLRSRGYVAARDTKEWKNYTPKNILTRRIGKSSLAYRRHLLLIILLRGLERKTMLILH